jgi:chemotaxis-related protein WspD
MTQPDDWQPLPLPPDTATQPTESERSRQIASDPEAEFEDEEFSIDYRNRMDLADEFEQELGTDQLNYPVGSFTELIDDWDDELETDYSTASASQPSLLDRAIPPDYLQERTQILAQPVGFRNPALTTRSQSPNQPGDVLSVMMFRLGSEWFAMPVCLLHEITRPAPIHTLPHRSNEIFLGVVNNRGEVLPCVSLSQFLQVAMPLDPTYSRINQRRLIIVNQPDIRWAFPVDEVRRVHRVASQDLHPPPVVVAKAQQTYTQGIIHWRDVKVNYLDAERLLTTLDRRFL